MSTRSYVHPGSTSAGLLGESAAVALAETFKVLGDPTRVRILDALARSEVPVCDLAELLGLTQSAVSHQLRLLRSMRLVRSRRDGRHIYYAVDDDHIVKLFNQGLEHVEERLRPRREERAPAAQHVGADPRVRPGPTRRSAPSRRLSKS